MVQRAIGSANIIKGRTSIECKMSSHRGETVAVFCLYKGLLLIFPHTRGFSPVRSP